MESHANSLTPDSGFRIASGQCFGEGASGQNCEEDTMEVRARLTGASGKRPPASTKLNESPSGVSG